MGSWWLVLRAGARAGGPTWTRCMRMWWTGYVCGCCVHAREGVAAQAPAQVRDGRGRRVGTWWWFGDAWTMRCGIGQRRPANRQRARLRSARRPDSAWIGDNDGDTSVDATATTAAWCARHTWHGRRASAAVDSSAAWSLQFSSSSIPSAAVIGDPRGSRGRHVISQASGSAARRGDDDSRGG